MNEILNTKERKMNDARMPKVEFLREQTIDELCSLDRDYFDHIIGKKYFNELTEPADFDINDYNSAFYGLWDIGA